MMDDDPKFTDYEHPAGGWGSVQSLGRSISHEGVPIKGPRILMHQNKPDGYACVSCAWAKPAAPRPFEFCEEGAKATTWEITRRRCTPKFFKEHTVTALEAWSDHDLEEKGRLTHPLRWNAATDKYEPIAWETAIAEIGDELRSLDPEGVVFYSSGRASLEASYMYALFARLYGNNNLPDSSNMCHESTSVGLPLSIGVPVGTITLEDFEAFGKIDILVNNAAFQEHVNRFEDLTEKHFDRTLKTNLYGYFHMAKSAVPHMKPGSAIVMTGSVTGIAGNKHLLDYSMTKGGIHAFARSLASHLIDRGIRVNVVAPRPVWTPLNPADRDAEQVARFGSQTPMKRAAQPEEIAPAFVFLAAPACSSYITGEILPIIGGYSGG